MIVRISFTTGEGPIGIPLPGTPGDDQLVAIAQDIAQNGLIGRGPDGRIAAAYLPHVISKIDFLPDPPPAPTVPDGERPS
jgi:hypothetical protein